MALVVTGCTRPGAGRRGDPGLAVRVVGALICGVAVTAAIRLTVVRPTPGPAVFRSRPVVTVPRLPWPSPVLAASDAVGIVAAAGAEAMAVENTAQVQSHDKPAGGEQGRTFVLRSGWRGLGAGQGQRGKGDGESAGFHRAPPAYGIVKCGRR
jgi:hypothetical protein